MLGVRIQLSQPGLEAPVRFTTSGHRSCSVTVMYVRNIGYILQTSSLMPEHGGWTFWGGCKMTCCEGLP